MGTKITKNRLIQTTANDKIQIRMVRKNIHTNRQILSIQQNMQQMRIPEKRPNTRYTTMDMAIMPHTPQQRHKRSKKHTKRSNKYNFLKKNNINKIWTRKSTRDSLVNLIIHKEYNSPRIILQNDKNIK